MESPVATARTRAATVVGLVVALGWPFAGELVRAAAHAPFHKTITDNRATGETLFIEWTVALVLFVLVVYWEKLPLSSIGWRLPAGKDWLAMAGAIVALFLTLGVFTAMTHTSRHDVNGATPAQLLAIPIGLRIFTFLTAGFCEELFFRAYAIERLTALTGNLWTGCIAAVVLFTLGHVPRYGFTTQLVDVFLIAVALTALYAYRRNFWICATMHAAIDATALLLAPLLASHAPHA